ncbi:hypothetical protein [Hymenobacter swuensis]|uniref:Uncharacterized protein n=1 Tax=Hymenobacter swuensis DY53 TaxID=1227739 RepID=W8F0R5_9BACT|nr:hypothetical protein [Hymenobacter swuensis]AHJ98964.1 hypothetical protein Hsw_3369 [Hymenobacter swuensis DY53]
MIKTNTTTNAARRETTVTATDTKGNYLTHETWVGTGKRVASALEQQVRRSAEQLQRRENIAAATSATEARHLAARL